MRYLVALALLALACGAEPAPAGGCPVPYPAHGAYLIGTCFVSCAPGWADCDGEAVNGCEADLMADGSCGRCGRTCGRSYVCSPVPGYSLGECAYRP